MAWLRATLGAMDAVEPVAMIVQAVQSEIHHRQSMGQEQELHDKEIEKTVELSGKELKVGNELHRETIRQAQEIHDKEHRFSWDLYKSDRALTNRLHHISLWVQRHLHLDNMKYTLRLFRQELDHAQNVSRKENIRDTLVQESQRAQAIMIVDTLMFGCCFTVLIEGNLPEGSGETLVVAFSLTLSVALACLIFSVSFAMNLQSRITKYVISDPNALYGSGKGLSKYTFKEYFEKFCKPVYKLTHVFMWLGTVALIVNGCILVGAKFAITHGSPTSTFLFVVSQALCLLGLSMFLFVYTPKLGVVTKDNDFKKYETFVTKLDEELIASDKGVSTCEDCNLPFKGYSFCPQTGLKHGGQKLCSECGFNIKVHMFCTKTGERHSVGRPSRHENPEATPMHAEDRRSQRLYTPEPDTPDGLDEGITIQPPSSPRRTSGSLPPSPRPNPLQHLSPLLGAAPSALPSLL
eukprot:TRINITY_DN33654_c0_g1_i1.p1 TRINITY_DN33654_c0_g1~~TRINITY_DN33654_c0_g1_i1.p1  ORF type:complete len:464 (+),score=63.05 TRINITY_DN33654_c0_g1_i1:56-1447(+)